MDSGSVIWDFEGPRCDWIPISKVQDAHLETLTLTSALNSDSEFGFRIFSCGFISTAALDSNFLFVGCFDSTVDLFFAWT
ncbi:unnamed protein product [Rhizophagus irregularis]|nr:unnamed protein product [Rhizophagus irregularis]